MDTKELQERVRDIFDMVSLLNVSGDAVDYVAAVRAKLRRLHGDIGQWEPAGPAGPKGEPGEPGVKEAVNDGGQNNG